jgi:hypothetical protein
MLHRAAPLGSRFQKTAGGVDLMFSPQPVLQFVPGYETAPFRSKVRGSGYHLVSIRRGKQLIDETFAVGVILGQCVNVHPLRWREQRGLSSWSKLGAH